MSLKRALRQGLRAASVALCIALLPVSPAHACSCAFGDAREMLADADAAFVGEFIFSREATTPEPGEPISSGRDVIYTFEVEESFKQQLGDTVEVVSAADGASCGLEVQSGRTYGLLLYEGRSGEWRSGLCSQLAPDELRAAAAPLPTPDGENPVRFLAGGGFGEGRMIALDEAGRTIAYGWGKRDTGWVDVCPGGKRSVEVVLPEPDRRRRSTVTMTIRRLRDFNVIERTKLPFDSWYGNDRPDMTSLMCRDRDAEHVLVFGTTYERRSRSKLLHVGRGGKTTLHAGNAYAAELAWPVALLQTGTHGRNLKLLDLRTGQTRRIARLKPHLTGVSLSPRRRAVTAISYSYESGERPMLHLIDTRTGDIRTRRIGEARTFVDAQTHWLDARRFILVPGGGDNSDAIVLGKDLQVRGRFEWRGRGGTLWEDRLYGITWDGVLVKAALPHGPQREIRRLISPLGGLTVVPGTTEITYVHPES